MVSVVLIPMYTVDHVKGQKGLKIVHMNCRSISNKIDEIRYLYAGIDILVCTETWLHEAIPNYLVEIPCMDLYRFDRDNGLCDGSVKTLGGGVACYIHRDLKLNASVQPDYSHICNSIEILTLKCVYVFGKIIHILAVYRPPTGSYLEFFEILADYIESGLLISHDVYICGDFNIDYLHRDDPKTKALISFLRTFGLKQHIQVATRLTGFSKSCIDFIISNIAVNKVCESGVLCEVLSDHHPVYLCVKKKRSHNEYCKIKGRTYKQYNKTILQSIMKREDWNTYYDLKDPTELWDSICKKINTHLNIMCPIKFIRIRQNSPPWITHEIVEAINDRNLSYKLSHREPTENNVRAARFNRNRVNMLITSSKATYIKETLNDNKDNPKKFWRILNDHLLKGSSESSQVLFNQGDNQYTTIDSSCEFLNNYLADVGVELNHQFNDGSNDNTYVHIYNNDLSDTDIVFSELDVLRVVKDINVHKGSGIEFLPTFILKDCFEVLLPQLLYLFNQSMLLGLFPDNWKVATITLIPKVGDCTLVNNWRPISIIPLIGKLMENLCVPLLTFYLENTGILCDEQYGFRKNRSTSSAIFNYTKFLVDEINNTKVVGSLYLDFAKAFDSIKHTRLIAKLYDMGVPPKLIAWLGNYLDNRSIRTK